MAGTLFFNAYSQNKPVKQIGLSAGMENFKFLDKHFSPLVYNTKIVFPAVTLFYNNQNNRRQFTIRLSGASGTINPSRFGERNYSGHLNNGELLQYDLASPFITINIGADYLRNIKLVKNNLFSSMLGVSLNESAYYGDEIADTYWLLNIADLAPALKVNYTLSSKQQLGAGINVSMLGIVTRPVYALFAKSADDKNVAAYFKQGSHLTTVDKFQKINFHIFYQYQVSRKMAAGIQYHLQWFHYALPKDISAVDSKLDLTFSITL